MSGWIPDRPRRSRRRLAAALVGVAALALLAGCPRHRAPGDVAADRVLRLSQRNEPSDLDPARVALPDDLFVIRALSEGLVAPAPDGAAPRPAAAESWDESDDGLTYTFHLRRGGQWSNGDPVTAEDFVASFRRALAPATAAPKAPLFFMVRNARAYATGQLADFAAVGFRAAGPLTLIVTLEHPTPRLLDYVASGPWIPVNPRVVGRLGRAWTRPGNFVGNGPFVLTAWQPHQRIVVRRNPAYHAAARIHLDEIQFLAFDNGDAEERAFRAGQLDVTMAIPFSKLETYRRERPDEAHRAPLAETRFLSFNTTRPPLNDRRVRRALALALDRPRLVDKVLQGGQEAAYRLLPPALREPDDRAGRLADSADLDADLARALLAEAGFPGGRGFPPLELSAWIGTGVSEAIQAMWRKELGIEVALVNREAKVHLAALRQGAYDIAFITAIPDVPDAANVLADFATGAPGNYPHWSDTRFDTLVAAAVRAPDDATRASLLRDAESRLLADCPLTPLYFNTVNWLMRGRVQGWRQDPLWTRYYLDLSLDEHP